MEPITDSIQRGMGRRMPLAVAGYYFFSLAGLAIAAPYLPLYWKGLGFSGAGLGALLTAMGLGPLLAQGPLGYLSDRRGQRRGLVFWSMAISAVVMFIYPVFQSLAVLFVVTLFSTALYRSSDALVQAMVGDWAEGTAMAATFGRLRVIGSIGWVFSLVVSARLALVTDMNPLPGAAWAAPMFLIIGTMYLLAAMCVMIARPSPPRERLTLGPWAAVKAVARAPRVGRFLLAFLLFWTAMQSIGAFLSLYMEQMGASRPQISSAFVVSAAAETPFIFLAGRLADQWGDRRLVAVAFAAMPVRMLLYAFAPSLPWVYLGQLMHSVTYGLVLVGAVTYMSHNLPRNLRASGQGALGVVMSAASTGAPFLGALVATEAGYRGAFVAMALVAVAGLLVLSGLPDDRGEEAPEI